MKSKQGMKYWLIPIAGFLGGCYSLIALVWINGGSLKMDEIVVPLICGIALAACGASACGRYFEFWDSIGHSSAKRSCQEDRHYQIRIWIFDGATNNNPPSINPDHPNEINASHQTSVSEFVESERPRLHR